MRWTVVMPVKGQSGKSRLDAGDARAALAVAFARDAILAASMAEQVDRVLVVTGDPQVLAGLGLADHVQHVEDPEAGLLAAIRAGLAEIDAAAPAAVLLADLPALRPDELDGALRLAEEAPLAFVPDGIAVGTTLLTAHRADELVPRFGDGSAARHRAAGHVQLGVAASTGVRLDVDELADLHLALDLGVGPHTQAVLDAARLAG